MSSSRQHPQSPPTALPTLLAANYIPPPKSPLCMSASSPLVEAIAPPKSSSSNLLQPPQHATTVPTHSQPNSSSIIARRRIPTPLPLISVREMPTKITTPTTPTHSPLRALFSSSSNNSSSYYSPSSPSPIRFTPASFSGSTSQLFILLNSPKNNVSTSSSTCALSPFLGVGGFF
uniref:Uncharacterized protein n=1 Tax=Meloidogyne incognita TaxID=6306 RepID=A0A914LYE5_MELIC